MLRYLQNALASRFDHPVFGLMYILAVVLAVSGIAVDLLSSRGIVAGFFAVFTVFFLAIGTLGYAILFLGKGISIARDKVGPAS